MKTWITVIVLAGIFYIVGQYIGSQPQRVAEEQKAQREISVQGEGTIQARPDIAAISLGVQTGVQKSAEEAINLLGTRTTNVTKALKARGINDDDIKTTNFSIQPVYDFPAGRQELRGYEATESVEVKIRNLDTIGEIISAATGEGVNQAGGISFTIDDPTELQQQARLAAIKDAQANAEELAKSLGVRLGKIKTFVTSDQPPVTPPFFAERALLAEDKAQAPAPAISPGAQEIKASVTVTYELD